MPLSILSLLLKHVVFYFYLSSFNDHSRQPLTLHEQWTLTVFTIFFYHSLIFNYITATTASLLLPGHETRTPNMPVISRGKQYYMCWLFELNYLVHRTQLNYQFKIYLTLRFSYGNSSTVG